MSITQTTKEQNPSKELECSYCGSILPSYASFCGICGMRLQKSTDRVRMPWLWPGIILLSAVAAGLVTFVIPDTALRPIIVMWFLFVCPGMMLVRFFRLHQPVVEWMLALALSFAFDAIVASILLYAGMWSTTRILDIVLGFSTGGAIVQLVTTRVASLPVPQQPSIIRPWKLEALLPVLLATLLIGLTIVASIWSPPYGQQTLGLGSFLQRLTPAQSAAGPAVTATPTPLSTVDAVIVMDNVSQMSAYDPQGERFTAAQLFVNLMPLGGRLGIVSVTSSPAPAKILDLQSIRKSSDKELVNSKLSISFFGPVDPKPTASFAPALQTAGGMLHLAPATDRKYILIVIDAAELSGRSNVCPASPDAPQNWFCMADAFEQQGISMVLVAFTKAGLVTNILPTKQYIEALGGEVLQVSDGVNVVQYLTPAYKALLTPIHASLRGKSVQSKLKRCCDPSKVEAFFTRILTKEQAD